MSRTRVCLLVLLVALAAGCSRRSGGDRGGDSGPSDAGTPDAAAPDTSFDAGPRPDGGPALEEVVIYAHSRDTLYSFSPYTLTVVEVGVFRNPDGSQAPFMLDLAVDSEGVVYTTSDASLYEVDPETADVTQIGEYDLGGDRLFALSFLARDELRADYEALVGAANSGAYYEVDRASVATTYLGQYPDGWSSSGDIVSVAGLGTFATVRRSDFPSDVLVQILFASDGTSTVVVKGPIRGGGSDFTQLFGLGYWGRVLYAFSNDGQLIEVDRDTGAGSLVSTETGTTQFWGAGVTTRVPVLF
jgi:hypothetical protein